MTDQSSSEILAPRSNGKSEQKNDVRQANPWDPIMASQFSFLNDLECIGEMVDLVLPVLHNRDQERHGRIKQLYEEIERSEGEESNPRSHADMREFLVHVKRMRQGERMFRQGVIMSIVSKFDEFLVGVLGVAYRKNAGWLKNPDKKVSYKKLLEIASLEALKEEIVVQEVDSLMRGSHYNQITFLDQRLKLGIEEGFSGWKKFLEATERRNLFAHTGGIVSPDYLKNCSEWGIALDKRVKEGAALSAGDDYIRAAVDCFYELSVRIAQASARRMFPECIDDLDRSLNAHSVELLKEERWDLAERLFTFAMKIPKDLSSSGEVKYYFLLNKCIALKFSGKDFTTLLNSIDWGPFHPKYHFAVSVLEDRFDDADRLMRTQAVIDEIPEGAFIEWPLLREFRETDVFKSAYSDLFGRDFGELLIDEAAREIEAQEAAELRDSVNDFQET